MEIKSTTPILRIFDEDKAREFYLGFLDFQADWEHRFGEKFPLYMQVSRGSCILHLSEHHGDGSPGAALRIEVDGIEEFRRELLAKDYKFARPGIEDMPWGTRDMSLADPFGNKLIFFQPAQPPRKSR